MCSLPVQHEHVFPVKREIEQVFALGADIRYGEIARGAVSRRTTRRHGPPEEDW
jgi:hypothetical protein